MKLSLPSAVATRVSRQTLFAQKHSPQVLFYGGLVLMAGSVVTACRGTLRLEAVLDDIRHDRQDLDRQSDKYTKREYTKINSYITLRGGARVIKLYLPAISLGVAAVACLQSSHNQLTRRNAGLSAALAATERALDSYRNRVREEFGEAKEMELWRGEKTESVEIKDEDGKTKKKKVKTGGGTSPYARVWGRDSSDEWDPRPEYNLAKLRSTQELCTMWLNHRGHLLLNEVFDELGLSRTTAGCVVGWKSKKYGGKDGFVDFGVLAAGTEPEWLDFVRGFEESILLDFNVDGEIFRDLS